MSTAEMIYELVKTMSENEANVVLEFAEFLKQKHVEHPSDQRKTLLDYFGVLKNSPSFDGDPVEIQRKLRSEWD